MKKSLLERLSRRGFMKGAALAAAPLLLMGRSKAQAATGRAADQALVNGAILTLDPQRPMVSAMAVSGGRVVALDSDRAVMELADADTVVTDLRGAVVVPGLQDATSSLIETGKTFRQEVDWTGIASLSEGLSNLREAANRQAPGTWLVVRGGWSERALTEGRLPSGAELSRVAPDNPVAVFCAGKAAVLNRRAMETMEIDAATPNPPGGRIHRNGSGLPTGLLTPEPSSYILHWVARSIAPAATAQSVREAATSATRRGVTKVNALIGSADEAALLSSDLPLKVNHSLRQSLFAQGEPLAGCYLTGGGEDPLRTAEDFRKFAEPGACLSPAHEAALAGKLARCFAAGCPVAFEATYDEGASLFLNAVSTAIGESGISSPAWSIVNGEGLSSATLRRIRDNGGSVVVRHRVASLAGDLRERFGAAAPAPRVRQMLSLGIPVRGGTDGLFRTCANPWRAVASFASGAGIDGQAITEPLNVTDTLGLYAGTLRVGEAADFAILDRDIRTASAASLAQTQATGTFVDGVLVS